VVPPNAIDDGEKVTIYMGATTSGPFDLPEDCKLRSAVVWLGSGSDVVLKRSITVVVPHSAVFTSSQHHSMMRFLTCEDCDGARYKFKHYQGQLDEDQGCIEITNLNFIILAIVTNPGKTLDDVEVQCTVDKEHQSHDNQFSNPHQSLSAPQGAISPISNHQKSYSKEKTASMPPAQYIAKLFWPCNPVPSSFKVDVYYLQKLPTTLYKVNAS